MKGNTKKNENLASQAEDRSRCEEECSHLRDKFAAHEMKGGKHQAYSENNENTPSKLLRGTAYSMIQKSWGSYSNDEEAPTTMRVMRESRYQRLWNTAYSLLQRSRWSSNKVQWRWWRTPSTGSREIHPATGYNEKNGITSSKQGWCTATARATARYSYEP